MTRGRDALLAILNRTKRVFVAARVRVTPRAVGHWATGLRKPSPKAKRLLAVNYRIRPESWDEPFSATALRAG